MSGTISNLRSVHGVLEHKETTASCLGEYVLKRINTNMIKQTKGPMNNKPNPKQNQKNKLQENTQWKEL